MNGSWREVWESWESWGEKAILEWPSRVVMRHWKVAPKTGMSSSSLEYTERGRDLMKNESYFRLFIIVFMV